MLAVDPAAGAVLGRADLTGAPERLAPATAPGGARLVVLTRAAGRRTLLRTLDATTGAAGPAIAVPGEALGGLLVTAERAYVPDALGHGVWVVDHRRGHLLGAVAGGRGPVAITSSPRP